MEKFLKSELKRIYDLDEEYVFYEFGSDLSEHALTEKWLKKRKSYIYEVSALAAIDSNKCDYVYIAIGVKRSDTSEPELKGTFYFEEGENDDIGRVLKRAFKVLKGLHDVFVP